MRKCSGGSSQRRGQSGSEAGTTRESGGHCNTVGEGPAAWQNQWHVLVQVRSCAATERCRCNTLSGGCRVRQKMIGSLLLVEVHASYVSTTVCGMQLASYVLRAG